MPDNTRMMAAQTRAAILQPTTFKPDTRTIDVVWTTGAAVRRYDDDACTYYDEVLVVSPEACDLSVLNGGAAPVLDSHNRWSLAAVVGLIEKAWLEASDGMATIRLSSADADKSIVQKVESGIIRQISVGYKVLAYEVEETDGFPIYRITKWQPFEISLVPIGADAGAGTRAPETHQTPRNVVTKEKKMNLNRNENDEGQISTAAAAPAAAPAAATAAADPAAAPAAPAAPAEAGTEQRAIAAEVTRLALRHQLPEDVAVLITGSAKTVAEARSAILEHMERTSAPVFAVTGSEHNRQTLDNPANRAAAMEGALLHRMAPTTTKLTDQARNYRHMNMLRMAEESLTAQGISVRGLSADQIAARALQSTSDFPSLLANALNKRLRQAYEENNPSYRIWARRAANAPDFKPIQATLLSNLPDLLQTNEHGEFKYGKMVDGKETYSVTTFGRIVGVTRQTLVNDDLRALDRMMTGFAGAAARLENRTVYAQLTANAALSDTVALFHATHGNLGTAAAIAAASLQAGRAAMRLQKGKQSEELNIAPRFLIAPASQEQLAYQFTSGNYVPAKPSDVNEFRAGGRTALEPVIDAVLDGSSTLSWYLAADSAQVDTVEYCYLDGNEGVYLESQMQFDFDGMKVKGRLDFAAKAIDYVGLFKNPGA